MSFKVLFVSSIFESDSTANYTMPFIDRQMESLKQAGLDVIPFSLQTNKSRLNYVRMAPLIKKIIINEKISIVHAHFIYSAVPCIIYKKVPVVLSLMGDDVLGVVGKKFKDIIKTLINRLLVLTLLRRCDAVIVKSNEMKKLVSHPNIHVIPNGIDFNIFAPMDMGLAKRNLHLCTDRSIILFAGDPENPRKNYDLALQVYKKVLNKYPNVDLIPLKNISHSKVPFYLNAASCLLLTSFKEGSPNILKEALACNIPVVSVDVGDAAERLHDLEVCAVCDFDAYALAKPICRILENPGRPELRDKIRYLDNSLIADKINKLYQTLL